MHYLHPRYILYAWRGGSAGGGLLSFWAKIKSRFTHCLWLLCLFFFFPPLHLFINIKIVKKKKIHFQISNGSHPSLLPTQFLTHFLRASSILSLLTPFLQKTAVTQGQSSGERVRIVQLPPKDRPGGEPQNSNERAGVLTMT